MRPATGRLGAQHREKQLQDELTTPDEVRAWTQNAIGREPGNKIIFSREPEIILGVWLWEGTELWTSSC